jgi:succinate dehydrogenase/fumarate reductase flavoprotein subunit
MTTNTDENAGIFEAVTTMDVVLTESAFREIRRLRAALEEIRDSSHQSYDNEATRDGDRQYAIGVADGHRCAANIARAALQDEASVVGRSHLSRADAAEAVARKRKERTT